MKTPRPNILLVSVVLLAQIELFCRRRPQPPSETHTLFCRQGDILPWSVLSFQSAIQELNGHSQVLPNLTLGYTVYEDYYDARTASDALVDLASTGPLNVPNYYCGGQDNLLAVLEGAEPEISSQIASMLNIYKIPQVRMKEGRIAGMASPAAAGD